MVYSEKSMELIQKLAKSDEELAKKILSGDLDAIRSLGQGNFIEPSDVLRYIDAGKIQELRAEAELVQTKKELYSLMIIEPLLYSSSSKSKGGK